MKYFLVDGTPACFYTAVFEAYRERECIITSERDVQIGLGAQICEVTADGGKAERVEKKLSALDRGSLREIELILRSCDPLKENAAFNYIKLIVESGGPMRTMAAHPSVIEALAIVDRVAREIDRLKGFLRFMENSDGVLYAPYSPDNDLTDILARHFARRFPSQKFVIHDLKRKKAALFDCNEIVIAEVGDAEIYLSEYEKYFENLWRRYYRSINVESRPHERQMKGYMPVRYWKYLPEKRQ